MNEIFVACVRSLQSLTRRGVLWHLLWPTLLAVLLWTVVGVLGWTALIEGILGWLREGSWTGSWFSGSGIAAGVLAVLVKIAVAMAFLPLVYVTAALLVATVALPMMLEKVGRSDYADLEERRGGSNLGSTANALWAAALFSIGMLLSLPLWLVPGAGLVVSLLLTGWLNQRAFRYDALMLHADSEEMRRLPQARFPQMLGLGALCATLAYVPVVNLFVPAFCGLAFVHFLLEALRQERARDGISILDPVATPSRRPFSGN